MTSIADALINARSSGVQISEEAQKAFSLSREAAYDAQRAIAAATGPVGGWKVGAPPPDANPMWAPIFAAGIAPGGSDLASRPGTEVGIEVEIAFRYAGGGPETPIRECLDAAAIVIETLESRIENPAEAVFELKLADNFTNLGLIVGDAIDNWQDIDCARQHVLLEVDGKPLRDAVGENPAGDPFRLIEWVRARGTAHCGGLQPGQWITTGSLSGVDWCPAGSRIEASFPDLGVGVAVTL